MLGLPLLIVAVSFGRSKLPVRLALILIVFVASFAMTNPFVFLDNSCDVVSTELGTVFGQLPIDIDNCYLDNIVRQKYDGARVRPFSVYTSICIYRSVFVSD